MLGFFKGVGNIVIQIIVAEIVISAISVFKQNKKGVRK
jgi:hypothetical protein